MQHYQVFISAETKEQANNILDALLEEKLVLGGPILEGPAKFWWEGEIIKMSYAYVLTYTVESLKERVLEISKKASAEEVPMISFVPLDGNQELIELIDKTLHSK